MVRVDVLGAGDLPFVEELIRDGETWALVDGLAGDVTGRIVAGGADAQIDATLDRWSVDADSFWVRRASMLALLLALKRDLAEWDRSRRCRASPGGGTQIPVTTGVGGHLVRPLT